MRPKRGEGRSPKRQGGRLLHLRRIDAEAVCVRRTGAELHRRGDAHGAVRDASVGHATVASDALHPGDASRPPVPIEAQKLPGDGGIELTCTEPVGHGEVEGIATYQFRPQGEGRELTGDLVGEQGGDVRSGAGIGK